MGVDNEITNPISSFKKFELCPLKVTKLFKSLI